MKRALVLVVALLSLACAGRPAGPTTVQDCVAICSATQSYCGLMCGPDTTCVGECARTADRCAQACTGG